MVKKELRYEPRPANRRATVVVFSLLVLAVCLFAVSGFIPAYGGIAQMVAILLIVPALFIAYKFILASYTYILTDPGDGIPCLLVEQTQGKRTSLVCRLPLRSLFRVIPAGQEEVRGKAFVYVATMSGGRYQYVVGRVEGTDVLLKLEADDAFATALAEWAAEERRLAAEE